MSELVSVSRWLGPARLVGLVAVAGCLACSDGDSGDAGSSGDASVRDAAADAAQPDASASDGGVADARGPGLVDNALRLTAEASGVFTSSTSTITTQVECHLNFIFEIHEEQSRTSTQVTYTGAGGGEVQRSLLALDGSGTAFFADSFGEIIVNVGLPLPGPFVLRTPINETVVERFWRGLARLEGTIQTDGSVRGAWSCGPFDIDQGGYVDNLYTVTGTFTATPEHIEPEPPEPLPDAG